MQVAVEPDDGGSRGDGQSRGFGHGHRVRDREHHAVGCEEEVLMGAPGGFPRDAGGGGACDTVAGFERGAGVGGDDGAGEVVAGD